MIYCPACGTDNVRFLGTLAFRDQFRCADCGMDFSRDAEVDEDEDEPEDEEFEDEDDGQPDWAQEWHDFDPDC